MRPRPAIALAFVGVAALGLHAQPARASAEARTLAREVAAPWPALQRQDGAFSGYLPPGYGGGYGPAVLGLGLLRTGIREDDTRLVDSSLRALGFAVEQDPAFRGRSVFEEYALAAAYNVARRQLRRDPRFKALRPAWIARLGALVPVFLARPRGGFFNKHVVEAATWLELARTGLRSRVAGSVLRRPRKWRTIASRYLIRVLPRLTDRSRRGRLRLLADPAPGPLAYHALSLGFYAHSLSLLRPRARRAARRTLAQAARASLALAAPDGDVAYTGRSQEQSWALSFTAYGAEVAAAVTHGRLARALRGLAGRTLARLRARHPVGPQGLTLVPALVTWSDSRARALDPYVDGSAYAGLTLLGLSWSGARPGATPAPKPGARSRRGYAILRSRGGPLMVVRTPNVWFAVRRQPDPRGDLRSDFGLVALKVRSTTGFQDVLPIRPRAFELVGGSGPILIDGADVHAPIGRHVWASRRGVTVGVGWGRLRWRPVSCGVRVGWRGRPGALYEYSAFFPTDAPLALVTPRTVIGGGQRISVSEPLTATSQFGYESAVAGDLVRVRIRFNAGGSGRASVTVCASGVG